MGLTVLILREEQIFNKFVNLLLTNKFLFILILTNKIKLVNSHSVHGENM